MNNPQTLLSIENSGTQNVVSPIITSQSSGTTYAGMYSIRDGAGDQRGLIFQVYTANVGLNEKFRIASSGAATFSNSIGIGTTPLSGNLSISHSAFSNAGTKSYTTDNVAGISAYVSSQDPYRGYLDFYSTRSGNGTTLGGSIIRFLTSDTSTTVNAIERMVITQTGSVGINTSNPSGAAGLALVLNSGANQGRICIKTSATGDGSGAGLQIGMSGADAFIEQRENAALSFATNATERMRINSAGIITAAADGVFQVAWSSNGFISNVSGISMQSRFSATYLQSWNNAVSAYAGLYLNNAFTTLSSLGTGTVYSNGGTLTNTNPSDERLKENIADLSWGLNEILQLRAVEYTWKDDRANQGKQYGFIAQEVEPIIPDLVKEFTIPANEELGTEEIIRLGLEKDGIFVALVKAIQEQQAQIDELKAIING